MSNPQEAKTTPPAPVPPAKPSIDDIAKQMLSIQAQNAAQKEAKVAAAKAEASPEIKSAEPELDWETITEDDVFDLTVPIPVIEQSAPDEMTLHIKDKNYVARWVHMGQKRLGMAIAQGYTFVTKEDWDPNFPCPLILNPAGQFQDTDVVAMKIHKSRYFPRLRKNHEQTMSIHGKAKLRKMINETVDSTQRNAIHRGAQSIYEEKVKEDFIPDDIFETSINRK